MSYVITDPCVGTCNAACTRACPMDCIHGPVPTEQLEAVAPALRAQRFPGLQLYIDPAVCIDCGACEAECPVGAIFEEAMVPAQWSDAVARNAEFFRR